MFSPPGPTLKIEQKNMYIFNKIIYYHILRNLQNKQNEFSPS